MTNNEWKLAAVESVAKNTGNVVLWIHADALNPANVAFSTYPGAPAIYVWDDVLLAEWQISLKRVQFIYECLLELPVTIRRGDVAGQVAAFAREHSASRIATIETPAPRFRQLVARLRDQFPVEVLQPEPFLDYEGSLDLARFSRYWRVASKYVFDEGAWKTSVKDAGEVVQEEAAENGDGRI